MDSFGCVSTLWLPPRRRVLGVLEKKDQIGDRGRLPLGAPMHADPAAHAILERWVARFLTLRTTLWWATEAPRDDLEAARVHGELAGEWEADTRRRAQVVLADVGPTPDLLRPALEQALPLPPLTPAVAQAFAEGRRAPWGGPDLDDDQWAEVQAVRQRAAARAEAAMRARAAAALPLDPAASERRARARAAVLERAPMQREQLQSLLGLRLPDHLFAFRAFWEGLDGDERALMSWPVGVSPGMVFDLLGSEALIDPVAARQHGRFSGTPPELVHALWGDGGGMHWGLWYDTDSSEPFLASFRGREGGGISGAHRTLLSVVVERARAARGWVADDASLPPDKVARLHVRLDRLVAVALALEPEADQVEPLGHRLPTCDEVGVHRGETVVRRPPLHVIRRAIQADAPELAAWVCHARDELAAGRPLPALLLGRDLHWLWSPERPEHHVLARELLVGAHRALGNPALAAIAEAHSGEARFRPGIATVPRQS